MNPKWYIGILVVVLAFLGISLDTASVPNQEIVVQFNDEVSLGEAESAVAVVKEQLEAIGVTEVQVVALRQGSVKITYYSDVEVAIVRAMLTDDASLQVEYATTYPEKEPLSTPFKKNTRGYELNIGAIHYGSDSGLDFDGYLIETKASNDRYFDPLPYAGISAEIVATFHHIAVVSYKSQQNQTHRFDATSYQIPEVRAGPIV